MLMNGSSWVSLSLPAAEWRCRVCSRAAMISPQWELRMDSAVSKEQFFTRNVSKSLVYSPLSCHFSDTILTFVIAT